jgi:pimeloyl-ACP methyl ester carboxylesterase
MLLEIAIVFTALLFVWIIITFRRWKRILLADLNRKSKIADTSAGEIEYALRGNGPVLLMLHGGPGGYDQGLLEQDLWINEGFSYLSISRPGYLRTPLSTGETFEQQADAIAALLDTLGIAEISILGASAGGPPAIHFALRYPDRVKALVLVSAVSQEYIVEEGQTDSLLGRIFVSGTMADFGVWIFDILTRRWPAFSLKTMFKEIVDLPSEEINTYVEQVMSNPEQVSWIKRFLQTTCPMSPRMVGLDNDLKQLERVSFTNLMDIKSPTLVIHGTADKDVSFANAEFSASSIPNARLVKFEGIGHIAWLGEHVSQMNEELVDFVRKSM